MISKFPLKQLKNCHSTEENWHVFLEIKIEKRSHGTNGSSYPTGSRLDPIPFHGTFNGKKWPMGWDGIGLSHPIRSSYKNRSDCQNKHTIHKFNNLHSPKMRFAVITFVLMVMLLSIIRLSSSARIEIFARKNFRGLRLVGKHA